MAEFKEIAPKPLSETESKTRYTLKSSTAKKNFKQKEEIKGGKGDFMPDSDFDKEQLRLGTDVEFEHTKDKDKAKEIAKDHLTESKDYYRELKKMEAKMDKSFERANSLIKSLKDSLDEEDMDIKKNEDCEEDGPGKIIEKAIRAIDILGIGKRQRLDTMYRLGAAAGRKQEAPFATEELELAEDFGMDKSQVRPLYEPLAVPVRRVATPLDIPPKKCSDHTYGNKEVGPEEAKPFWRR